MISKVIHYCWLSGDPFPDLVGKCIASWKEKLPDYELVLWNSEKIDMVFGATDGSSVHGNLWLRQSIQNKKYAFSADYIRVYALYHYGGIYLDADVEISGSFEPFLKNNIFIGFEYNNDLEPAIIGSIPKQPWIKDLLDYYENRSFIKEDGTFDIRTLPTIFNESAIRLFNFKRNGRFQMIIDQGIFIYPHDYFSPKNVYFNKIKETKNTIAIHHFDGNWVERNLLYYLKRIIHQSLYILCGKKYHNKIVQIYRGDR